MGHLIVMTEQLTTKVEANMNAWREGNNACWKATDACLEKLKAETDANQKKMKADREAMEAYPEMMGVQDIDQPGTNRSWN
jgi:hypothetical protein